VITWEAPKEQIFEMPLGGAAIMRKGPNLLKLPRKEHCLALTTQLRNKFKLQPCFYRVYPSGEVEYLHPMDGVYPEKVNAGRVGANQNMRRIGENVNPIKVRRLGGGPAGCGQLMEGGQRSVAGNAARQQAGAAG
jgi:photosystem I subunit 2